MGTSILRVRATDLDQINTNNSEVAYSLSSSDPDAEFFSIDNMTGIISNARILVRVFESPAVAMC